MSSLAEMLQYAQAQDAAKQGIPNAIGDFGEAVGKGFVGMQDRAQQAKDKELERASKYLDLQSKVASIQQSQLLNDTLKSVTGANESDARASAFQNLGANATAGVEGVTKNTNAEKFNSTMTDPTKLAKKGYTTEVGISDGKPYLKMKEEQDKPGSTVEQLTAIQHYVDTKDPTKLATAFPTGEMPQWATEFMAKAHENKTKQDDLSAQRDQVKTQAQMGKMSDAIDPSKQRTGAFGVSKQVFDRAERLQSLASALPDGNLDSRQMEELAIGLNSMLSGSNTGAQSQVESLVPKTIWGNTQKLTEWLSNEPQGTQQQAFVKRMLGSIEREKQTAATQIKRTQFSRLAPYASLEDKDPVTFQTTLQSSGIDPAEYQAWKKGGFKPISAVAAPGDSGGGMDAGGQEKTVQRKGKDGQIYTYTLNEKTGKYE